MKVADELAITLLIVLIAKSASLNSTWNLYGKSGNGYYLPVEIGSPSQKFNLLVDTGSSNLAIAGGYYPGIESHYTPNDSSSFVYNGTPVEVLYYQGRLTGYLGQDLLTIPSIAYPFPVMTDLAIITEAEGFYVNNSHWQGILGLAFKEIAKPHGMVEPWFDSFTAALPNTTNYYFSIELCGPELASKTGNHHGRFSTSNEILNCSQIVASTPLHRERFFEILISEFQVGDKRIKLPCTDFNTPRTIIDSGTTNLQLSANTYHHIVQEMKTQAESLDLFISEDFWFWGKEACFEASAMPWLNFPNIVIYLNYNNESHFGVSIPPHSFLRPSFSIPNTTYNCFKFGIEQSHVGTVLGAVFLEGLCVTFDRGKRRLLFSPSSCGPNVKLLPIKNKTYHGQCSFSPNVVNGPLIATSVILVLVMLPLFIALLKWVHSQLVHRKRHGSVPFVSLSEAAT